MESMKNFSEIQSLRIFIAIVEARGMGAAARKMGQTSSALSQRLRQFETKLGTKLLHRSTRKLQLTEEGTLLYERGKLILGDLDALQRELHQQHDSLAGPLRLFGPPGFGRSYLAALVAEFHAEHPEVDVSLTLSDRLSAHAQDRFDLVVHIGEMPVTTSAAYMIAPNARYLCASPEYLKTAPPLRHPSDLQHHRCLILRENDEDATLWQFHKDGRVERVRVTQAFCSNDGEVVKQWALAGKGLIIRSEWSVQNSLANGDLVRVMPEWHCPDADILAIVPHRDGMPTRVRRFLEFLRGRFSSQQPWSPAAPAMVKAQASSVRQWGG
jgi:DNA-binding transcriptional LysR family regulator